MKKFFLVAGVMLASHILLAPEGTAQDLSKGGSYMQTPIRPDLTDPLEVGDRFLFFEGPANVEVKGTRVETDGNHVFLGFARTDASGIGSFLLSPPMRDGEEIRLQEAGENRMTVVPVTPPEFLRGDANMDGNYNLSDAQFIINYLYRSGPAPDPLACSDANGDGTVDLSDAIYILNNLFMGGPPPPSWAAVPTTRECDGSIIAQYDSYVSWPSGGGTSQFICVEFRVAAGCGLDFVTAQVETGSGFWTRTENYPCPVPTEEKPFERYTFCVTVDNGDYAEFTLTFLDCAGNSRKVEGYVESRAGGSAAVILYK